MPRTTNLEKYKEFEKSIDKITNKFCLSFFPDGVPKFLYDIYSSCVDGERQFFIRECVVDGVDYFLTGKCRKPYFNKRPSSNDVLKMKILSENLSEAELNKSEIRIYVKEGNRSWASSYTEIESGKVALTESELQSKLEEKIKHYEDNYRLSDNQFACSYCGKAVDNDKKIIGTVISRQYQNFRKDFDYCSSRCASHDQMAHEG